MARTILTHKTCGGNVVVQYTGFRLISPLIQTGFNKLSVGSLQFLTEDFKTPRGDKECTKIYVCMKCGNEIPTENLGTDVLSMCVVCKEMFPVNELYTTDYTSINCGKCIDDMKGDNSTEVKQLFDIPARFRHSSFLSVLLMPVKI